MARLLRSSFGFGSGIAAEGFSGFGFRGFWLYGFSGYRLGGSWVCMFWGLGVSFRLSSFLLLVFRASNSFRFRISGLPVRLRLVVLVSRFVKMMMPRGYSIYAAYVENIMRGVLPPVADSKAQCLPQNALQMIHETLNPKP